MHRVANNHGGVVGACRSLLLIVSIFLVIWKGEKVEMLGLRRD